MVMAKTAPKPKVKDVRAFDTKVAKLKAARKAKQLTASEYADEMKAAKTRLANASKATVRVAPRTVETITGSAAQALKTAAGAKRPLQMVGTAAKNLVGMGGKKNAAILAATYVVPKLVEAARSNPNRKPTVSAIPSNTPTGSFGAAKPNDARFKLIVNKTASTPKRADAGDSSRTAKPLTAAQKAAAGPSRTHTVKKGDSLWAIAQANNTTVSALLKANPELAKRKAAGKTTIYSGSKVRLPGKK